MVGSEGSRGGTPDSVTSVSVALRVLRSHVCNRMFQECCRLLRINSRNKGTPFRVCVPLLRDGVVNDWCFGKCWVRCVSSVQVRGWSGNGRFANCPYVRCGSGGQERSCINFVCVSMGHPPLRQSQDRLRQVLDERMRARRPRSETSSNSHTYRIDTGSARWPDDIYSRHIE